MVTHVIMAVLIFAPLLSAQAQSTTGSHSYEVSASTAGSDKEKALHIAGLQACVAQARLACEGRHGRVRTATQKGQRRCQIEASGAKHCEVTCTVECAPFPPVTKPQDLEAKPTGPESTID